MSNLVGEINIDAVLDEIRALANHKRLTGNDDMQIDLNTQITAFIRILFGDNGVKNSGDDKIAWLKKQSPIDRSKIDLTQLNVFLSVYRNSIESIITASAAAPLTVVTAPAPAPAPISSAPPAPSPPLTVVTAPVSSAKPASASPVPADLASASDDSDDERVAPYASSIQMDSIKKRTDFQNKLLDIGFSLPSVLNYTTSHKEDYDLDSAINDLLQEKDNHDIDKRQENLFILNNIFGRDNADLIYDKLKEAKGDIISAGDLISRALEPSEQPPSVPTPTLKQPSIFNGGFFQHKETGLGCGRFALNNLLGGRYFKAVSQKDFPTTFPYTLANIKDIIEDLLPTTKPTHVTLDLQRLCKYLKLNNEETMDDCLSYELYDQSVITNALNLLGYTVVITGGRLASDVKNPTIDMLDSNTGMIVNLNAAHYISIRKHGGVYYLMDSENKQANEGSAGFIRKLLEKSTNITFVVGPYDVNTSKKTVIRMKIQEYVNHIGDEEDPDNEDFKQNVLLSLYDFITNSDNSHRAGIDLLYNKEIQKMPYELIVATISERSMTKLAELLTNP